MRPGSERVHLVGVGGSGMSGLARLLHGIGGDLTGSDQSASVVVDGLQREGFRVWIGSAPERVHGENGYVVRSAAVPAGDPEVRRCEERGFTSLLYAEAVGRLSEGKRTLAVAGAHGKTTTTALTVSALRAGGLDPSHLIGGEVPSLGGNGHGGRDDLLVVEACEFNRSFHQLRPYAAAILNFDHDHFDCYPTTDDLVEAYAGYAARVRPGGRIYVDEYAPQEVVAALGGDVRLLRVGSGLFADLRAVELADDLGRFSFVPVLEGRRLPRVHLRLSGRFQVANALFALGLATTAGCDPERAVEGLSAFTGVQRRFEMREGPRGGILVNDYAHHPAEIRAVLRAARRRFPGRRLLVAFQPHQHERTWNLLDQFADALAEAEHTVVLEIYGARESEEMRRRISAQDLIGAIRARGAAASPGGTPARLRGLLGEVRLPQDVTLMLGAGDIAGVVEDVVADL
jgi:UDP-N-acetylmuramate--alanine ligase